MIMELKILKQSQNFTNGSFNMRKSIVIKSFNPRLVDQLRDLKNTTIYLWKSAINTWDDVTEFAKLLETNKISVVYFDNRENPFNKKQWVIKDENNNYWSGYWGQHPFGGRARVFIQYDSYAKKYFSEKVALRIAESMRKDGVFGKSGKYTITQI